MHVVFIVKKKVPTSSGDIQKNTVVLLKEQTVDKVSEAIYLKNQVITCTTCHSKYFPRLENIRFKIEDIHKYSLQELAIFLSAKSEIEFAKMSLKVMHQRFLKEKQRADDQTKLCNYYRDLCLYKEEVFKQATDHRYLNCKYDYKKIKEEHAGINKEIVAKFKLFNLNRAKPGE